MDSRAPLQPRVLMVTGAYLPELSGGGLQCKTIIDALAGRVTFAVLTTCTDSALPRRDRIEGVPVFRVHVDVRSPPSKLGASVRMAARLIALHRQIDIIHLHGFSQKSLLAVLLGRVLRKKIVLTIHTAQIDEPSSARAMGRLAFWCYANADLHTAVSPTLARNCAAAGLPSERVLLIANAVDSARFRPPAPGERESLRAQLGLAADRVWILFVGFFSRDKAPDVLFEAWMHLQRSHPHTALVFVGATESPYFEVTADLARTIRARAAREGVADRVRFVEPTPAVEDYFRAVDLFVAPSVREGFGMALAEAMACELPVIASRLDGVTNTFVKHRFNGLLVPPRSVESLAMAMAELLDDLSFARSLGQNARATVIERFGTDVIGPQWLAAYERVTAA